MKVRKLDSSKDMTFGNGLFNFYNNEANGIVQNVYTRLSLILGEWFLAPDDGVDYFGKCLGKTTAEIAASEIRRVILATQGVTELSDFNYSIDVSKRSFSLTGIISTDYGNATLSYSYR